MERFLPRIVCRLYISNCICSFLLLMLLGGCKSLDPSTNRLPFFITKDLTPQWNIQPTHQVANFSCINQLGKPFSSDVLQGKIYLANFFFTSCPGICIKMTNQLSTIQDSIAQQQGVQMLSFSVMPWVDSVAELHKYAKKYAIRSEIWQLLTGDKAMIYRLGRNSFFADDNMQGDTSTFLHSDKLYLVDGNQHIRGVYNATRQEDMHRVLQDIRMLKNE